MRSFRIAFLCTAFLVGIWIWGVFGDVRDDPVGISSGSFVGTVVAYPDVRRTNTKLVVLVHGTCSVDETVETIPNTFRVLATTDRFTQVSYGDVVCLRGEIERPEPFEGFRYDRFLGVSGITHVVRRASVETVGRDPPSGLLAWLLERRERFEASLRRLYPEPTAGFLEGLLLGTRAGLSEDLTDAFNATGMTHIVALSGANVTLLATVSFGLLSGALSRRSALWATISLVFAFVVLTGMSSSLVRAGIMGTLVLVAREIGRPSSGLSSANVLLMSAVLMSLWRPLSLAWDPGFQLSFAATFGILFVASRIDRFFGWLPKVLMIRESVTLSVASQITTLPLVLWHFGRVAWIAPLANMLVLPVLPWAMLGGFLSVAFSGVAPMVAKWSAFGAHLLLMWAVRVIAALAAVS